MSALLRLALLAALSVVSLVTAVSWGAVNITPAEVWAALTGTPGLQREVILELRLPRALTAFAVGGLLAVAGALMQVLLRNPLADPYILGISGGAAVGALMAMLLGLGGLLQGGAAFAGALLSTLLVFALAHGRGGAWTPTRLLLTGVVVAAGWGAMISLLLALSPEARVKGMLFWLMGDMSAAASPLPALLVLLLGLIAALPLAPSLNVLARGDAVAASLGVTTARLRLAIYALAALLTAMAVSSAGTVGFVGLIVPHLLRLWGGADHRWLLPGAALGGGSLVVLADTLARTVAAPLQLPVGAIMAVLGAPLFLYLLNRRPRP